MNTYTIKEISEMFQLPASTLRYYEEIGILTGVERTPGKQRIYYERHVNRLRSICCFKRTGMSMTQLQVLFQFEEDESKHIRDILNLLEGQRKNILENLEKMKADLEHVNRKLSYYRGIESALAENKKLPNWADYNIPSVEK